MADANGGVGEREAYGARSALVGIGLNAALFLGKYVAGLYSRSISITADAFNNLSDAGSSVVTLIGFRLAGAKPDHEHPFGHGRMEYVAGLVVSAAILLMGYQLVTDSVRKIRHPSETEFSPAIGAALCASILVKLGMALYYYRGSKKIDSVTLRAAAADSMSDCGATAIVLAAALIEDATGAHIDGWCGALVGLFVFYAGFCAARDTINPLLGQPPDEEFVREIERIVMSHEGICGVHDLIVHDYGPGRKIISLHAEVPADGNLIEVHDVIDGAENELRERLGCDATIHMDPIVTSDKHVGELKKEMTDIAASIDGRISLHDFRVAKGPSRTKLIFDAQVPFQFPIADEELSRIVQEKARERLGEEYSVVMRIDKK